MTVPPISARGTLRPGFLISPAAIGRYDHPLYAHTAPTSAAPNPDAVIAPPGACWAKCAHDPPRAAANAPATMPNTANTLMVANPTCNRPPARTPAQLIAASAAIGTMATTCGAPNVQCTGRPKIVPCACAHEPPNGTSGVRKVANETPSAAIEALPAMKRTQP